MELQRIHRSRQRFVPEQWSDVSERDQSYLHQMESAVQHLNNVSMNRCIEECDTDGVGGKVGADCAQTHGHCHEETTCAGCGVPVRIKDCVELIPDRKKIRANSSMVAK